MDELSDEKKRLIHTPAWQTVLRTGETVWVDRLSVTRNYLGLIQGTPSRGAVRSAIEKACELVQREFRGPAPVVIPPLLFDAESDSPILPPLRFAAQIRSWDLVNPEDEGSWMNLVWFAEIDDDKSVKQFVEEALQQVDWLRQAEGYAS